MSDSILISALQQAFAAIFSADPQLWEIILLSLQVSLSALVIALLLGIPLALTITVYEFPGRQLLKVLLDTLMALPPVVIGLIVYLIVSRSGPLGIWGLLYTPSAMILAQSLLITPLVAALAQQFFRHRWQVLGEQLAMMGFKPYHAFGVLIREARTGLVTVGLAAFGRAIAEIGAVMVVGGNIEHHTRVMTTAIAMETRQGNLALALSLGIILITLALVINSLVHFLNRNLLDIHHGG